MFSRKNSLFEMRMRCNISLPTDCYSSMISLGFFSLVLYRNCPRHTILYLIRVHNIRGMPYSVP